MDPCENVKIILSFYLFIYSFRWTTGTAGAMWGRFPPQLDSCMLHLLGSCRSSETVCSILTNTMNLLSPRINTDRAPPQQSRHAWEPDASEMWGVWLLESLVLKSHYVWSGVCWCMCGWDVAFCWVWIKKWFWSPTKSKMNHSGFNIPSGNLSSLPHTVFNSETVKEHLALDLEQNSVSS